VRFTYTGTNADSFLWDFGDGSQSMERNPLIAFPSAGAYFVTLTAENSGGSRSAGMWIAVSEPPPEPEGEGGGGGDAADWILDNWPLVAAAAACALLFLFVLARFL
jgi:PKD repeat protein